GGGRVSTSGAGAGAGVADGAGRAGRVARSSTGAGTRDAQPTTMIASATIANWAASRADRVRKVVEAKAERDIELSGAPAPRAASREAGQQRYESYRIEQLLTESARCGFDHRQALHAIAINARLRERQHHAAGWLEI